LERAVNLLNAGRKVVIMAGRGALGARSEVAAAAERLGAPVVKPLLGKGGLPDDHPYTTGGTGFRRTPPAQGALANGDTLLIVGSGFPYIEFYPKPGQAKAVQIELDPQRVGLRYPVDAALVGDSARILRALLPRLDHKQDRSFIEKAQHGMLEWRALMDER